MNVKATCVNPDCVAKGLEKSVLAGEVTGHGAGNGRVTCSSCGELMKTTKAIPTTHKGPSGKVTPRSKADRKINRKKA